jgi:radical SAM superfamily enzyme YgiQ (UPF0313 family)
MKVLVTNPPWPGEGYGLRSDVRWPHRRKDKYIEYPIYLAYVVAILKKEGIETEFIDGIIKEMSIEEFGDVVAEKKPDMTVLECSTPSIDYDLQTAKVIKERLPECVTVLVGSHPTVFHKEILQDNAWVDIICRGEFDYTVRDIARALNNDTGLDDVKGITYRDNGNIKVNPDRELIQNLDELPFPDREAVPISDYKTAHYTGKNATCFVSSRGCPYRCTFCVWPNTLYGHKFRTRSPENVIEEIEELTTKYGVEELYIDDDSFTLDRERVLKICRMIQDKGIKIKWFCQVRVNQLDEELMREMKNAGCHTLFIGVESGDERMLKLMKKGINLEETKEIFRIARKLGLKAQAFFMLGLPGETQESINKTIKFAKELKPFSAQFAVAIPHPGSELYDICKKKGWLKFDKWEDFDACNIIIETNGFTKEDIAKARDRAYREFYFRPGYILDIASRIRSIPELIRVIKSAGTIIGRLVLFRKARKVNNKICGCEKNE